MSKDWRKDWVCDKKAKKATHRPSNVEVFYLQGVLYTKQQFTQVNEKLSSILDQAQQLYDEGAF